MKVEKLIEELEQLPEDTEVHIAHKDGEVCQDIILFEVFGLPDGEMDWANAVPLVALSCSHVATDEVKA